jgi:hypothetical protein
VNKQDAHTPGSQTYFKRLYFYSEPKDLIVG